MSKRRLPIFQNLSKLLKVFIFVARVRKLSFENSFIRKLQYSKTMKLLKNYDYGFVREYQFSLSNTPLIRYHRRRQLMKNESLRVRDVYSMFFLCKCWGNSLRVEGEDGDFTLEALPTTGNDDNAVALYEPLDWEDHEEEASIDLRAQMFIERFYEEMRMQRQESF